MRMRPPVSQIREIIRRALDEDVPWGDITTETLVPVERSASARFVSKEDGVVCGIDVAELVFAELDASLHFQAEARDGDTIVRGQTIAVVSGPARPILTGERTALNLMQRLSGIATEAARYLAAVEGTGAVIVDTRKTVPGLRVLDKYAVRCGGAGNHRFSLSDGVLVKDNHVASLAERSLVDALKTMRSFVPHTVKIEVEVDRLDQIEAALSGGADIILLDNMSLDDMRLAVNLIGDSAVTEASGGITLDTVRGVAETGVDLISVGALTHSVRALDISLDLEMNGTVGAVGATLDAAIRAGAL